MRRIFLSSLATSLLVASAAKAQDPAKLKICVEGIVGIRAGGDDPSFEAVGGHSMPYFEATDQGLRLTDFAGGIINVPIKDAVPMAATSLRATLNERKSRLREDLAGLQAYLRSQPHVRPLNSRLDPAVDPKQAEEYANRRPPALNVGFAFYARNVIYRPASNSHRAIIVADRDRNDDALNGDRYDALMKDLRRRNEALQACRQLRNYDLIVAADAEQARLSRIRSAAYDFAAGKQLARMSEQVPATSGEPSERVAAPETVAR